MMNVQLAKSLMKKWEAFPPPPGDDAGELQEVFRHAIFVNGTEAERKAIMLASSESKYRGELAYPWDHYFGTTDLVPLLRGKAVLDLGCFTGGRGAAWFERYKLGFLTGIDVKQEFIDAATQFARLKKIAAEYRVAQGEQLPFEDNTLDAILSYDVFEHVQNVRYTLGECHRVLKKGGRLFVVFPGYFHPTEHHLDLATKLPCIHYFFSGETLVRAYNEILEERGEGAYWYKRQSPANGTLGERQYDQRDHARTVPPLHPRTRLNVVLHSTKPIGSIGRNASKSRALALLSHPFGVAANIPGLHEMFLHRITYILQKGE